jgi:hypothetical protein
MKKLMLMGALATAVALALGLAGCKGKDGSDGGVYAYLSWSSDIKALDLSDAGITDSTIYANTRYTLTAGLARIYWLSNSTTYYLDVEIEDGTSGDKAKINYLYPLQPNKNGDDGQDRVYYAYFSGNTLYYSDELVTYGAASAGESAPALPNALQPGMEGVQKGVLKD